MWATHGFVRGIVTSTEIGNAFCTPRGAAIIMSIINCSSSLTFLPSTVSLFHQQITQQVIHNFLH